MNSLKDHTRAVRYRQLAIRETDKAKAAVLNSIADEAERGVLVTSDRSNSFVPRLQPEPPQPPQPSFRYRGTPPGAA